MRSQKIYWLLMLLTILSVVINLTGFMEGQDWGDDFSAYIIQAQTLSNGDFDGLRANIQRNDYCLSYPWGFPILLVPVIKYFDSNLLVLKVYIFVFFISSLVVFFLLFKHKKEYIYLAVLLVAANPFFWNFKNYLLTDFPNMLFVLGSLYFIDQSVIKKRKLLGTYLDAFVLGITIYISYVIRNQSIILLPLLAVMQVIELRKQLLKAGVLFSALLPYLMFFVAKLITEFVIPIPSFSYVSAFHDIPWVDTVWNNIFYYTNIWVELFGGIKILGNLASTFTGAAILFFLIGITLQFKENLLSIFFILGSIGVVLVLPYYQGIRYLVPVIPIFFYFFVKGVFQTFSALYPKRAKLILAAIFIPLTLLSIVSITSYTYANYKRPQVMEGPYRAEAIGMFNYLRSNTDRMSIIGFWKPRVMLLYGERNSIVTYNYTECINRKADYYVYYRNAYADQIPLDSLAFQPTHFNLVFENPDFKVFKVLK